MVGGLRQLLFLYFIFKNRVSLKMRDAALFLSILGCAGTSKDIYLLSHCKRHHHHQHVAIVSRYTKYLKHEINFMSIAENLKARQLWNQSWIYPCWLCWSIILPPKISLLSSNLWLALLLCTWHPHHIFPLISID